MGLKVDEILDFVTKFNNAEIERRREYYAYLCSREPQAETFVEHVEKYGNYIRTGEMATDEQITALEERVSVRFPDESRQFFRTIGRLHSNYPEEGQITLHSVSELTAYLNTPSDRPYQVLRSLGLIDMIKLCWGNDRFEFEPRNGYVTQAEIDRINAEYACIGWLCADLGLEAHEFAP